MHDKAKDLFAAFKAGKMSRRELMSGAAKLGVSAATANFLFNAAATQALAADFDWKKFNGTKLHLLLNKHPYADAMIADLDNFKSLTGMDVTYDIFPEDVYFDKVTAALSSKSSQYDAFMTGAYMTWTYGPAGWIEDLNTWIKDPAKTNPKYDWEDVQPGLRASTAWNGVPGAALGSADAKQWCIPWGFELNSTTYNRKMYDKAGVKPANNLPELIETTAKLTKDLGGPYGIGVRGSRSWATIHPGFLSGYSNYGQRDFTVTDGKLKAAMDTARIQGLPQDVGADDPGIRGRRTGRPTPGIKSEPISAPALPPPSSTPTFSAISWMAATTRRRAISGSTLLPPIPEAKAPTPNVWIWSLAMNTAGKQKDAAWYWMQWASSTEHDLFGARKMDFVNPVRASVWKDEEFRNRIDKSYSGYLAQYDASAPGARIYFTPQPLFFDVTTQWAETLQKMVAKQVPVDDGLDQLAASIDKQLKDAGLG